MLVTYAKQETTEPLKTLGSYLAWGLAGALCVFLGTLFVSLGVLRLFQSEFADTFGGGGGMSTLPYVFALVVLIIVMGIVFSRFQRSLKKVNP